MHVESKKSIASNGTGLKNLSIKQQGTGQLNRNPTVHRLRERDRV